MLLMCLWKCASVGLHLIGFLVFGYALIWDGLNPRPQYLDPNGFFGGRLKYMTYWNLCYQLMFNSLWLVCDILPYFNKRPNKKLRKCVDTVFHTIAFPFAMFVSITFWSLCSIDQRLVRPRIEGPPSPDWFNHVTHTLIAPMVILELIITYHKAPPILEGLLEVSFLCVLYSTWILSIGIFNEYWTYPFLESLNWLQRIAFSYFCGLFIVLFYLCEYAFYKILWTRDRIRTFKRLRHKRIFFGLKLK